MTPGNVAKAEEKEGKSIDNNTIRLWATNDYGSGYWADFKFLDMGDGTVRLRPTSNGNIINPSQLSENTRLAHPYTIKFYDNEGSVYYSKDSPGNCSIKSVALDLANVKMRYGLDSIQVTYELSIRDLVSISGGVKSNLDYSNFDRLYKETASRFSFRVERDGLYAEPRDINQVRIPDGEYTIETAENSNRVLDVLSGNNIGVSNYDSNRGNQKFILQYDNLNKAYKIRGKNFTNGVISWTSNQNANVMLYPDDNSNDQFWYLENAGSGRYRLISARHIYKWLNLDANNTNISVADRNSHSLKQQFKFVKAENKKVIEGDWQIASKLDNNKVLHAYYTGNQNGNVVINLNNDANNQKWTFKYESTRGAYAIINKENGKALTGNSHNNNNVFTYDYHSGNDQYWILEDVGNGYYIFRSHLNQNLVLDLPNSDPSNHKNVVVANKHGGNNQQFKLIK